MGRVLAIDYGSKRIGIAVSDETKTIAQPKPYVPRDEKEKLIEYINQNEIEEILLGLPIALSGKETAATEKVKNFAAWLKQKIDLPLTMIDERLTTKEILRTEKDRELIDSLVAQKMLERYLEKNRPKQ
ncbi:MAG: hypothetical protein A3C85_00285 [Candidatus Doudnabacteria bacterium RIFCSPHIGHO2_02_FULL_48_21]|uniref:Putative pre-16S rRNA nuclease n=1 Tax=Candidatus Doudnabacteria bacterium RIFCSPLOWO2_02_FULL_48_13 TaxID=1817845 RepID=A0A1F5QD13_9BACT|nr:MAG: hypothetical protein A3K05_01380 [Candidatus Doudnabacteria bacterium RIFCSPHIGHO2_01_48_18]OGE77534.1 MAG: hypothetical protein A2668_03575 [Candidatus Doudnabacteria bacterium RIFCSPHIGHO2_01_FULL_48_180]OGE91675.1 MAG: hypothetical protein A3F44_03135 [Candidatus Doudnabacteria bacterium RIFCSPHIGHO2_12_FULL_47_25]OGE93369.1 MAG: hypothetical protein A3C85_00285 [Candidatus Doudnabacteria bacterium RIFCSPHIGHO2_02_FULL_48_21]OGE97453.1 MAG: hypothetical protein A3A83_01220 [Candidatu